MPPHEGLVHPKEYDWRDSNVELINSDIDHKVKYQSASTEPAWNNGAVGSQPGLFIWRIEDFTVVPWPKEKYGQFHEGDSYIVLYSEKVKSESNDGNDAKLVHDIFFWLGSKTSQDEAGTAAYKTVELDEFLHGTATQHREVQAAPSDAFLSLFPRIKILRGGVASGFTHVEEQEPKEQTLTLLRIFKSPSPRVGKEGVIVHEVEPHWKSLDENDVFVLDKGDKIFVWQGKGCSPMEKMKAAQVVNDLTIAKHVDVEVLSQNETRSKVVVDNLGGADVDPLSTTFKANRPLETHQQDDSRPKKLFKLSDASGQLSFSQTKDGRISKSDLDSSDVFLLDAGSTIWVWEGNNASRGEKAAWMKVAQAYLRQLEGEQAYLKNVTKVVDGHENQAFWKAVEA